MQMKIYSKISMTLQNTVDNANKRDVIEIMGDLNAKLGKRQDEDQAESLGPYGLGTQNERGKCLVEFLIEYQFLAMNSL